jgi:SPP1 family predicted phage head-tail adaptor
MPTKPTGPGDLTQLVDVQAVNETYTAAGRREKEWVTQFQVWAALVPTGGVERYRSGAERSGVLYRMTTYRRGDITEQHRIMWRGVALNVRSVPTTPTQDMLMDLLVESGVNT